MTTKQTTDARTDEPIEDGSSPSGSRNCYPFLVERLRRTCWKCREVDGVCGDCQERHQSADAIERLGGLIEWHIRIVHNDGDARIDDAQYDELLAGIQIGIDQYREHAAKCDKIVRAAKSYVDIRSNHPQVAGEAWRDLCSAVDG